MEDKHSEKLSETTPLILLTSLQAQNISPQYYSQQNTVTDLNDNSPRTENLSADDAVNATSDSSNNVNTRSYFSLPRRAKFILIFCSSINFLASTTFALLGPFFPQAAAKKGMDLTEIGVVFSCFQLIIFIASPVIGAYLTTIGAKFVFTSGIFASGFCGILFGTLEKGPNGSVFIVMCILTRCIQALGCAAFQTASFAIVSYECRDMIGTAYAILETFAGLGYMLGPLLGGVLYTLGGFGLPFYVMGSLVLLNGIVIYTFLPSQNVSLKTREHSLFLLLKNPLILVVMGNVIINALGITAYDSVFSTQMQSFHLKVIIISVIYAVLPGMYTILGPIWGYLTDTKRIHRPLLVLGSIVYGIGWLLSGPSVLLPFLPNELWVVLIGIGLLGFSMGAVIIPSMKCCIEGSVELGFEANLDTYALVSGLFNACVNLGGFLGPTAISPMVQSYGFPVGYTVLGLLSIVMGIITAAFFSYHRAKQHKLETSAVAPSEFDKVSMRGRLSTTLSISEQ